MDSWSQKQINPVTMKKRSTLHKILVPTDFSQEAINAIKLGAQIAERTNGELTLLYVLNYPGGSAFNTMTAESEDPKTNTYVREILDEAKEVFEKHLNDIPLTKVKLIKKIQIGNPFTNISDEISQNKTDIVVMGTKGSGGVKGNFIGSNTEKVVRRVSCPVISIKENITIDKIRSIVFPTRFEKESAPIVNFLKEFKDIVEAEVKMVFINTPSYFQTERAIKKHLADYVKRFDLESFQFDIYNELTEEKGILSFASDMKSDMIALGTHGRKGLAHLFAGSIAEDLVIHSKRPVLTMKIGD